MSLGEHFLKSTKKILSTVWPHLTLRLVVLASDYSSPAGQGFSETDFLLVLGSKLCFSFVSTILSFVQKYFVNQSTLQGEKFKISFFLMISVDLGFHSDSSFLCIQKKQKIK